MTIIRTGNGNVIDDNNALPTKTIETTIIQPVDIQSRYAETVQTHNAVSITASGSNISAYVDTDGFENVVLRMKNDTGVTSTIQLIWTDEPTNNNALYWDNIGSAAQQFRYVESKTKARYVAVYIANGDAALAHVISALLYLKA